MLAFGNEPRPGAGDDRGLRLWRKFLGALQDCSGMQLSRNAGQVAERPADVYLTIRRCASVDELLTATMSASSVMNVSRR